MNATVYDLDGDDAGELELPDVFETTYRSDLVRRAVLAAQANRTQDAGTDEYAGLRTPAESFGSGRGLAHVPRQNGRAREVPQAVSGRAAHPPKTETDRGLDINDKERKLATRSAIAATADADLVSERGHAFDDDLELPLVVSNEFETLVKTADAVDVLESLGVYDDVRRAENGKSVRSGRGTTRGRKYQQPKSLLVVTSEEPSLAARNLAGVDVSTAANVDTEDLAPGTHAGRLTLWTEAAIEEVAER
ncbi:MAG: 50S ribosomal protein L4 [Natronomonas sp.]